MAEYSESMWQRPGKPQVFPALLLLLYGFLGWSVPPVLIGLPGNTVAILVTQGVLLIAIIRARWISSRAIWLLGMVWVTALIQCVCWTSFTDLRFAWMLSLAALLVVFSTEAEKRLLVDMATILIGGILLGAVCAAVYSALGGSPYYGFPRPGAEDQQMFVLPFSLALSAFGDQYLRVTGIYDEPGALSFVVCVVAFLRDKMVKNATITWSLLALGIVTFSLAHIIFIICFAIASRLNIRTLLVAITSVTLFVTGLMLSPLADDIENHLIARIVGDEMEGRIVRGDNRTGRLELAAETILHERDSVWIGISRSGDPQRFKDLGENPLTPLARYGIVGSWPYYAYLLLGIGMLTKRREDLAFFGIILLLLQRPYVQSEGYSLLALLPLWAQWVVGRPSKNQERGAVGHRRLLWRSPAIPREGIASPKGDVDR